LRWLLVAGGVPDKKGAEERAQPGKAVLQESLGAFAI
jgi:hypothetical protein